MNPKHKGRGVYFEATKMSNTNLENRKARCSYYGKAVKKGMYNSNCCDACKQKEICKCEKDSSPDLWFFRHKPDEEFDEFYCACHGAD